MTEPSMASSARAHLAAEGVHDLEMTLATMEPPYFRELWPIGLRMEGYDITRTYYEHHFQAMRPRMHGSSVGQWESEEGLVLETRMEVAASSADEPPEVFRILTALVAGPGGLVTGERIYAADRWHQINVGPFLDTAFSPVSP